MKIQLEKDNRTIEKKYSGKVSNLLKELDINPVTVIVLRDQEILTTQDSLRDSDEVIILSVISGG
ncbi:thiamine biosynthesis protein ThiS [Candidatus Woesearchaeota archaeon]|nr:thiamine biosynthesis protein ThiS [Candidatus Woesearchaeota archaeon]